MPRAAAERIGGARESLRELICAILQQTRDPAKIRADAAKMRADMARHKPPAGPLDVKLGPGGLVDLEFAVHTLQLMHGEGLDPRLEVAIAELAEAGPDRRGASTPDLRLLSRILVVMRLVAPDEQRAAGEIAQPGRRRCAGTTTGTRCLRRTTRRGRGSRNCGKKVKEGQ